MTFVSVALLLDLVMIGISQSTPSQCSLLLGFRYLSSSSFLLGMRKKDLYSAMVL